MDKFIVQGEVQLTGKVRVSGAKNAVLPILAACLLCSGQTILHEVPLLRDVLMMQQMMAHLGVRFKREGDTLLVDTQHVIGGEIPDLLMREMRASVFLMGPLVARLGEVCLTYPGGCAIGPRPIDLHIKALERLGAKIEEKGGVIQARTDHFTGNDITFDFPSVGATENAIMAAALAKGITRLHNAAREPEIAELQNFLNAMGAKISGAGSDMIEIEGVAHLQPIEYTIMPDRIEAGTMLIAGALTGGDILVEGAIARHLRSVLAKLQEVGAEIQIFSQAIRLKAKERHGVDIKTLPFPGFPTDLQAPMLSLLTIAKGTSIISETIFENRFKQIDELCRMGAQIRVEGRTAIIRGVDKLAGARVSAPDLRAGSALVLAALAAEGFTEITQIYHIDRGYEQFEQKLQALGAKIVRQ